MKIIRKLLRFFYRDPSAGHVTSFSRWLACWSVRVVALFYGRESTELVSIWYVFQFYLALYLHVLYFYFSFHRSSWKNLCLSPTSGKSFIGIACFQVWSMDASKRLNFGFDIGRGLPDYSIQLPVVSTPSDISLPSFYESVFTAIERFAGRRWLSFSSQAPADYSRWIFGIGSEKGLTGPAECGNAVVKY